MKNSFRQKILDRISEFKNSRDPEYRAAMREDLIDLLATLDSVSKANFLSSLSEEEYEFLHQIEGK